MVQKLWYFPSYGSYKNSVRIGVDASAFWDGQ